MAFHEPEGRSAADMNGGRCFLQTVAVLVVFTVARGYGLLGPAAVAMSLAAASAGGLDEPGRQAAHRARDPGERGSARTERSVPGHAGQEQRLPKGPRLDGSGGRAGYP